MKNIFKATILASFFLTSNLSICGDKEIIYVEKKDKNEKKDSAIKDILRVGTGIGSLYLAYKCGQLVGPDLLKFYNATKKDSFSGDWARFQLNLEHEFGKEDKNLKLFKTGVLSLGSLVFSILGLKLISKGTHLFE